MDQINVLPIGSEVVIGGDIKATINGIQICEGYNMRYGVVYWKGRDRVDIWVAASEVKGIKYSLQIGFVAP